MICHHYRPNTVGIAVLAGAAVSLASPANLPTANDFKWLLAEELVNVDENPLIYFASKKLQWMWM